MLSVRLMGGGRLLADGCDITPAIRYRKGWALLAYLAVERERRHTREHLSDLLWPDLDACAARTNLRQVLGNLNQVLESGGRQNALLTSTKETIGLFMAPDVQIDLLAFDTAADLELSDLLEAERVAAWVDGGFLSGFTLSQCPQFEQWLDQARLHIGQRVCGFLERLCGAQERADRLPQAITTVQSLIALDPWNETHHRRLLRLLAASGQANRALAAFDRLCAELYADLGVAPDARTIRLRDQIYAGQQAVAAGIQAHAAKADARSERKSITVVYCESRTYIEDGEHADAHQTMLLEQLSECLCKENARMLPGRGRGLFAYFESNPCDRAASGAARAALCVQRHFAGRADAPAIGIYSGLATIQPNAGVPDIVGDVPALAMRLCLTATTGEVVAGGPTVDLLESELSGGAFVCEALGSRNVPGFERPVHAWRLSAAPVRAVPASKQSTTT